MKENKGKKHEQENDQVDSSKFFNEKEYNTLIVSNDGVKLPGDKTGNTNILIDPASTREEKDEALKQLKESNDPALLIEIINKTSDPLKKSILISACWEINLNFSDYLLNFIELACADDFSVAMEASTVILQMETLKSDQIGKAKDIISRRLETNPSTSHILSDILDHLNSVS